MKPSSFRCKTHYTNFDFKTEFVFPDDHFAVPFASNLETECDENGISHCKFACLNADDFKSIQIACPMHKSLFDKKLQSFCTVIVPCIDPNKCQHNDFCVTKSFNDHVEDAHPSISTESGEFCNLSDENQVVLSYWHKDLHDMKVLCEQNPPFVLELFGFQYQKYHSKRSCTYGLGLNVYDGKIHVCFYFNKYICICKFVFYSMKIFV